MKKITIEMPIVAKCGVDTCAYNSEGGCHARAITVGDGNRPGCDTYLKGSSHTREKKRMAGVGACKVRSCRHNDDFECMAESIEVGYAGQDVLCLTYNA